MNKTGLYLFISTVLMGTGCQVVPIPEDPPKDHAIISNARFYDGNGGYETAKHYYSVWEIDGKLRNGLYSKYTNVSVGKHEFKYRCRANRENATVSFNSNLHSVEGGKCYKPIILSGETTRSLHTGIPYSTPTTFLACDVSLEEVDCDLLRSLGRSVTAEEIEAARQEASNSE